MIRGMARAARELGRVEWLDSAQRSMEFVRTTMWREGRLFATHKDGKTHLNAYLDDYAFLLDALIELIQVAFRPEDLSFASALADALLEYFEDRDLGGYFFTSHDHERLLYRNKPGQDNATPSGNGIAAFALQRFGHLLGETRYLASAARTLKFFHPHLRQHPSAFPSLLNALEENLEPARSIVLRGPNTALGPWLQELRATYRPHDVTLVVPDGMSGLPQTLTHPDTGQVHAWICQGVHCLPPITEMPAFSRVLVAAGGE